MTGVRLRRPRPAGTTAAMLLRLPGLLGFLGLLGLLVAGCTSIPADGPIRTGRDVAAGEEVGDPYVRVFAEPPRGGETVYQIVEGFLEASGTVEPDYATARAYLVPATARSWAPRSRISVYDHNGVTISQPSDGVIYFTAGEVGSVDDQGQFMSADPGQQTTAVFRLGRVAGEWRIVDVPPGLYVSRQDFAREYRALNRYFFDPQRRVLVPDPVFLPVRAGLATPLTQSLLRGPSRWLAATVVNEVPTGTGLDGDVVEVAGGVAHVRLTKQALASDSAQRERMIAQLVATLGQAPEVSAIRVSVGSRDLATAGGKTLYELGDVTRYQPADRTFPQTGYYLRAGRLHSLGNLPPSGPIAGPLGDGRRLLSAAAAVPDGSALAAIGADRRTLWTAPREQPDMLRARLTGRALHSPSYDQFGNLWIVDGTGPRPAVRWLPSRGNVLPVLIPGLGDAGIRVLRVADDGTRVALVATRGTQSQVLVGVVRREPDRLVVTNLRRLGHRLLSVRDVAWSEGDELVVLAAEARAQLQPYFVSLDGSQLTPGETLADIDSIAAAPGQPLLASTTDKQIWRLRPGGPWTSIGPGEHPLYPG